MPNDTDIEEDRLIYHERDKGLNWSDKSPTGCGHSRADMVATRSPGNPRAVFGGPSQINMDRGCDCCHADEHEHLKLIKDAGDIGDPEDWEEVVEEEPEPKPMLGDILLAKIEELISIINKVL